MNILFLLILEFMDHKRRGDRGSRYNDAAETFEPITSLDICC